jgi:hypothetical protein
VVLDGHEVHVEPRQLVTQQLQEPILVFLRMEQDHLSGEVLGQLDGQRASLRSVSKAHTVSKARVGCKVRDVESTTYDLR